MQNQQIFRYDGSVDKLREAVECHKQGGHVLCDTCGSELVFVLTPESTAKHQAHPGIYCPVSSNHVSVVIEMRTRKRNT
jgi:hypothetical protein